MLKKEFLEKLEKNLSGLPREDIASRIDFYSEMIDDKIEDGLTEEDAVKEIGNAEDVARQVLEETPITKIVKERIKPKRKMNAFEIILLILGSPVWLSLLIAFFCILLAVYIVLWSILLAILTVNLAIAVGGIGGIALGVLYLVLKNFPLGIMLIGAGLVLTGLSIFMFFFSKISVKGIIELTKKIAFGIKSLFLKKEGRS